MSAQVRKLRQQWLRSHRLIRARPQQHQSPTPLQTASGLAVLMTHHQLDKEHRAEAATVV
jgi:hypothetical protein